MSELFDKVERGESLSDSEFKGFVAEMRETIADKRAMVEVVMRVGMHNAEVTHAAEIYMHKLDMLEKELDWGEKYYG